jgi:hypothetical protein
MYSFRVSNSNMPAPARDQPTSPAPSLRMPAASKAYSHRLNTKVAGSQRWNTCELCSILVPRYFQWERGGLDAHGMMTGDDTGGEVWTVAGAW